MTLCC